MNRYTRTAFYFSIYKNVLLMNISYIFIYFIGTAFRSLMIRFAIKFAYQNQHLYCISQQLISPRFLFVPSICFFITNVKSPKSQGSKFRFKSQDPFRTSLFSFLCWWCTCRCLFVCLSFNLCLVCMCPIGFVCGVKAVILKLPF